MQNTLPYRATIFLKSGATPEVGQLMRSSCESSHYEPIEALELMERSFAKEADAVVWCNVMTEAEPLATGVWFVAKSLGGRMLVVTRETGLAPTGAMLGARDELGGVLAEAGLRAAGLTLEPAKLEAIGCA